ncbi:hypothetical protein V7152_02005 [Neobacillus drentensis]|uniref:hypothetical protein n=1 Tax=Neobacillus drentensis TaxID=220684 RepID=UPI002FFF1574
MFVEIEAWVFNGNAAINHWITNLEMMQVNRINDIDLLQFHSTYTILSQKKA